MLSPEIEGVLVVAEGAGNGTVNRTIVEIVQALFGVEAHKVKVVKMEPETTEKMFHRRSPIISGFSKHISG